MKTRFLGLFFLALFAQGCQVSLDGGSSEGNTDEAAVQAERNKCAVFEPNTRRYIFTETFNGKTCTTKCQVFYSLASYCAGLLDENLNNHCAGERRRQAYASSCM